MPGTTIGETYRANLQTGVIYGAETDEDGYQGPDEAESFAPPTRPTRAISNPMHADRALAPSPSETKEISSTFLPSADA